MFPVAVDLPRGTRQAKWLGRIVRLKLSSQLVSHSVILNFILSFFIRETDFWRSLVSDFSFCQVGGLIFVYTFCFPFPCLISDLSSFSKALLLLIWTWISSRFFTLAPMTDSWTQFIGTVWRGWFWLTFFPTFFLMRLPCYLLVRWVSMKWVIIFFECLDCFLPLRSVSTCSVRDAHEADKDDREYYYYKGDIDA